MEKNWKKNDSAACLCFFGWQKRNWGFERWFYAHLGEIEWQFLGYPIEGQAQIGGYYRGTEVLGHVQTNSSKAEQSRAGAVFYVCVIPISVARQVAWSGAGQSCPDTNRNNTNIKHSAGSALLYCCLSGLSTESLYY